MIQFEKIKFKSIDILVNNTFETIEIIFDNESLNQTEMEAYIHYMTILVEYSELFKPKYIILDKLNSNFKLTPVLFNFTKQIIFKQLRICRIKKLILVVNKELYEHYYKSINKKESFMIGFDNKEDVYEWIAKNYGA